jgi:hypothetical protein
VSGNGWSANFPAGWKLERGDVRVTGTPEEGTESVAVATFPLRRAFRSDLWDEAVGELDVVARDLSERLSPLAQLSNGRDTSVAGRRARVYEIRYERGGVTLVERVAFLFDGRREYQLTCRIEERKPELGEEACSELLASFSV